MRFFGGQKKSIEIHIFEPQKVQSRLYRADATSRYDVRESCATNLSCCFFWGGCLGGMQGSSACFVWALAPYYKKKGSYIFLYILSYMCSFIFIFGYLCILFIPMKVQPAIFVLDIWGWFTNSHLSMKALASFQRKHHFYGTYWLPGYTHNRRKNMYFAQKECTNIGVFCNTYLLINIHGTDTKR